jgi:hypothetical protein
MVDCLVARPMVMVVVMAQVQLGKLGRRIRIWAWREELKG